MQVKSAMMTTATPTRTEAGKSSTDPSPQVPDRFGREVLRPGSLRDLGATAMAWLPQPVGPATPACRPSTRRTSTCRRWPGTVTGGDLSPHLPGQPSPVRWKIASRGAGLHLNTEREEGRRPSGPVTCMDVTFPSPGRRPPWVVHPGLGDPRRPDHGADAGGAQVRCRSTRRRRSTARGTGTVEVPLTAGLHR